MWSILGGLTSVDDVGHAFHGMLGAVLPLRCARHAEGRVLGALAVDALLASQVGHAWLCVFGTVLGLRAGHAEVGPSVTAWLVTPLVDDVDHFPGCVAGTKFALSGPGHAEGRLGVANLLTTLLGVDVDHASGGMFGTKLGVLAAGLAVVAPGRAALLVAEVTPWSLALVGRARCLQPTHVCTHPNSTTGVSKPVSFCV